IQALPADIPADPKSAAPSANAWPPNHNAAETNQGCEPPADTVRAQALGAKQQVAMQLARPMQELEQHSPGLSDIPARVGIEQPLLVPPSASEGRLGCLACEPSGFNGSDRVIGIGALNRLFHLLPG